MTIKELYALTILKTEHQPSVSVPVPELRHLLAIAAWCADENDCCKGCQCPVCAARAAGLFGEVGDE